MCIISVTSSGQFDCVWRLHKDPSSSKLTISSEGSPSVVHDVITTTAGTGYDGDDDVDDVDVDGC